MAITPVENIKQRLSIIDVVSSYVVLQKAGKSFKGKSPFVSERTPSFFVSPDRGMYYCFSTGKGGDIFSFIQEMEGVDFKGALKILAERAGVELTAVDPRSRDDKEKLLSLLEDATRYFVVEMGKKEAISAYLVERGLRKETIEKWRIGYAPAGWRNLKEHLLKKGYTEDFIFRSGLLKKTNDGSKNSYDVFRDRIMFPIADSSGRVVGFSGRIVTQDPGAPKYVNSPETELFVKSQVLFGYDHAKSGIRTFDFSLVVEGQFDLVLSHQAGYTNTVALSGTALSLSHVEILQRLSNKVVLALDADRAGIASAKRLSEVMLKRGMDVKVARIMGGKDPADLVREDQKLLKQAVGGSVHVVEFLLNVLRDEVADDRTFKLRVREEVLPFIALMPNKIDQEHFARIVGERLGVTEESVRHEISRVNERAHVDQKSVPKDVQSEIKVRIPRRREEDLVSHLYGILLWQQGEESPVLDEKVLYKNLELVLGHDSMQSLVDWGEDTKNEAIFKTEALYAEVGESLKKEVASMLHELYVVELRRRLAQARERLRESERSLDTALQERELALCSSINETLKEIILKNPFEKVFTEQ